LRKKGKRRKKRSRGVKPSDTLTSTQGDIQKRRNVKKNKRGKKIASGRKPSNEKQRIKRKKR